MKDYDTITVISKDNNFTTSCRKIENIKNVLTESMLMEKYDRFCEICKKHDVSDRTVLKYTSHMLIYSAKNVIFYPWSSINTELFTGFSESAHYTGKHYEETCEGVYVYDVVKFVLLQPYTRLTITFPSIDSGGIYKKYLFYIKGLLTENHLKKVRKQIVDHVHDNTDIDSILYNEYFCIHNLEETAKNFRIVKDNYADAVEILQEVVHFVPENTECYELEEIENLEF